METLKANTNIAKSSTRAVSSSSKMESLLTYAENNRFGIISMILIFMGCMGGVTLALGGLRNDLVLITLIISTMTTLALILAVQPMKYILTALGVVFVANLLITLTLLF